MYHALFPVLELRHKHNYVHAHVRWPFYLVLTCSTMLKPYFIHVINDVDSAFFALFVFVLLFCKLNLS